jgi:hypothetical protein
VKGYVRLFCANLNVVGKFNVDQSRHIKCVSNTVTIIGVIASYYLIKNFGNNISTLNLKRYEAVT